MCCAFVASKFRTVFTHKLRLGALTVVRTQVNVHVPEDVEEGAKKQGKINLGDFVHYLEEVRANAASDVCIAVYHAHSTVNVRSGVLLLFLQIFPDDFRELSMDTIRHTVTRVKAHFISRLISEHTTTEIPHPPATSCACFDMRFQVNSMPPHALLNRVKSIARGSGRHSMEKMLAFYHALQFIQLDALAGNSQLFKPCSIAANLTCVSLVLCDCCSAAVAKDTYEAMRAVVVAEEAELAA